MPEFEKLKRELVEKTDIILQVSRIGHRNSAHHNVGLFGPCDETPNAQGFHGPLVEKELGLLHMRKHIQTSSPPSV